MMMSNNYTSAHQVHSHPPVPPRDSATPAWAGHLGLPGAVGAAPSGQIRGCHGKNSTCGAGPSPLPTPGHAGSPPSSPSALVGGIRCPHPHSPPRPRPRAGAGPGPPTAPRHAALQQPELLCHRLPANFPSRPPAPTLPRLVSAVSPRRGERGPLRRCGSALSPSPALLGRALSAWRREGEREPIPVAGNEAAGGANLSGGDIAGPGDVLLETTKALKGRDLLETDKDITWKHFRRGRQEGWRENRKCPPCRPPAL